MLVGVAWAGDVWREKPASAWTAEEALKILVDSPWAHERVVLTPPAAGRKDRRDEHDERGPVLGGVWEAGPRNLRTSSYLIRWESARPVVEAFARLRELGMETSAEFQSPPPLLRDDRYTITMKTTEPPRRGSGFLDGLETAELQERARLKTFRGEVAPAEVVQSGVGANAAVHFQFPREHNGQPLLRARAEVVEFIFKAERATLKQKFRLEPGDLKEWEE